MVHVQVAPAHPVGVRHRAEKWMCRQNRAWIRNEAADQRLQSGDVDREFCRPSPADFLVDFGAGWKPVLPLDRKTKRAEFDDSRRQRWLHRTERPFAHHSAKRIGQMADHLVRVHAAPLARAVGPTRSSRSRISFCACESRKVFMEKIVARFVRRGAMAQAVKRDAASGCVICAVQGGFETRPCELKSDSDMTNSGLPRGSFLQLFYAAGIIRRISLRGAGADSAIR